MYIFTLFVLGLMTFIAYNILRNQMIKRLWLWWSNTKLSSNKRDVLFKSDENEDESIEAENTKELPTPEDNLYKFFLKHKRRRLRVNKHFLQAPICKMENLFARTYPNEYGHPPSLKIVSHFPNKLLK